MIDEDSRKGVSRPGRVAWLVPSREKGEIMKNKIIKNSFLEFAKKIYNSESHTLLDFELWFKGMSIEGISKLIEKWHYEKTEAK